MFSLDLLLQKRQKAFKNLFVDNCVQKQKLSTKKCGYKHFCVENHPIRNKLYTFCLLPNLTAFLSRLTFFVKLCQILPA